MNSNRPIFHDHNRMPKRKQCENIYANLPKQKRGWKDIEKEDDFVTV